MPKIWTLWIDQMSHPLPTGLLFSGGKGAAPKPGAAAAAGSPPEISREEPEGFLNLRDPWARVYLARGCAAVIQSGHIAGVWSERLKEGWMSP